MERDTTGRAEGSDGLFDDGSGVKSKSEKAGGEVADKARELGHQVEDAAVSKAEEGRHRVAEEVHRVGEALRTGARELREGDDDRTTDFIERLAEPVERISEYLERHDTREMASELEDFGRRNQAVFLGGAFALGMLGARFLKASSESRKGGDYGARDRDYDRHRTRLPMRSETGAGLDPLYDAERRPPPPPPESDYGPPR